MPLRSTGCLKCRQRKIRCDEERPGCKRCRIHGVVCPGFKTARKGDIEFEDQTDQTVQRLQIDAHAALKTRRKPVRWTSSEASTPEEKLTTTFTWAGFDLGAQQPLHRTGTPPVTPVNVAPTTPIWSIHSPAAMRAQLHGMFLQLYVPQDIPTHGPGLWSSNKRFLHSLMELPSSGRASLSHALDALTLVQIGSTYRNPQLLNTAVEAYGKSLRGLRIALSKPEKLKDDAVLATTCVLSSCEFYTHFRVHGHSWVSHQHGTQRLLEQRGPESILSSPLAVHLFYQLTTGSLFMSLLTRRRDPYSAAKWSAVETKATDIHDDLSESNRLGLRLPALLERHDRLDWNHPGCLASLDHLLFDCEQMEMEMKSNLATVHARDAMEEKSWIALVDIEYFHPFSDLIENHTMTRAFRFPSFQTGYIHSSHWFRMFMLRQTIRSLFDMRQRLVPGWLPPPKRVVHEKELLFYVLSLCRLVPFFIEPAHGATGDMCCFFLLRLAEQYFRANRHGRWVSWVEHVSARVFMKGMSMPFTTMPPTEPGSDPSSMSPNLRRDDDDNNNDDDDDDDDDQSEQQLAFNKIEFPNAPLLADVGRKVTPQGTVWMPSRAPSSSRTNSSTPSSPFGVAHSHGTAQS